MSEIDAATLPPLTFREVLRIKALRRMVMAQAVSVFGDLLAIFAIFSVISFRMHASATDVTLVMVFYLLPLAIVSPIAGVFVDSWHLKRTMITSDLLRAVLFLLLLVAGRLWEIYAILLAASTVSSFFAPAQMIAVRLVVPKEGLTSANALLQQAFLVMQIVSPAAAGLLVSVFGPGSCFALDTASFLFSAAMISTLAFGHEPVPGVKTVRAVWTEMRSGASFIFTHSAISFVIIAMTLGMFAVRCFSALIAVYVRDVLHGGSSLFGILGSLVGFGMIIGSQLVRLGSKYASNAQVVTAGVLGTGLSIALLAAFPTIPGAVLTILGIGFFVAFIFIPSQVLLQEHTPQSMLGRVSGSMMAVMFSSQVVALLSAGALATSFGIRNVYFGSALLLLPVAAWGYYRIGKQRAIKEAAVTL